MQMVDEKKMNLEISVLSSNSDFIHVSAFIAKLESQFEACLDESKKLKQEIEGTLSERRMKEDAYLRPITY
jgi:cell division protein FtsL